MGVEAILLSAGESSRMGKPKALLDWFGQPLVLAQTHSLLEGGTDHVIVVTGAHHDEITDAVIHQSNITITNNPNWSQGKTTSIKTGLKNLTSDCQTIIILAVDQPRPAWVVDRALQSHLESNRLVTSPRYSGHGGHPLLFDASLLIELSNISEKREGLREVMKRHDQDMNRVYFENPIVRFDLNTPEDYETALTTYPSLSENPNSGH